MQDTLDDKASSNHTHDDRYYTESEIDNKLSGKANISHTHTTSQITDFPTELPANGGNSATVNGHTVNADVPENAVFTDTVYDDTEVKERIENINSNLTSEISRAKETEETLADKLSEIDTSLDGKANSTHTHTKSQITDFPTLGTASAKDVPSTGNASNTQVVMGNDTRLTNARPASDVPAWAKSSVKPSYSKSEVGLGNVDNTSDTNKPVSTAQQTAIDTAYANANKYTDKKVADLIGSAPETMDTLEEVAAAIQENKDVETALNEATNYF